jgi:NTE family protein
MFNFLKKKKYGLALGAGGIKGFVHIGVIKALEELDIEITHIGGSSIGSLIGGMYAIWRDINKVEDTVLKYDRKKLFSLFSGDIGLLNGVFKGDSFIEELDNLVGNASISDCLIPYVAVSVDILTGEKIYHTTGLLKDAIRASCSLPFAFKPYELGGRVLVDGGLAESVPVLAIESIGAKRVLGVNIQNFPKEKTDINIKTLGRLVYRASMTHLAQRDMELADMGLTFNLEDMDILKMVDEPEKLIQMGYDETKKLFY